MASLKPIFSYLETAIKARLAKELTGEIYVISELDLADNNCYLSPTPLTTPLTLYSIPESII